MLIFVVLFSNQSIICFLNLVFELCNLCIFDFMYKREYFDPCVFVLYFSLVTITMLRGKNLLNRGWLLMSLGLGICCMKVKQEY